MTHLQLYAADLLVLDRGFSAYITISIGKKDNEETYSYIMQFCMYIINESKSFYG